LPYNGAGQFSLVYNWQTDAANGLNISSSRMEGQDADIAAGLSICLTKDGQQQAAANLPMGGFTLTNIANAIAQKQPISVQDFQNGTPTWLGTVSGIDTISGAANIATAAYAKGQKFRGITAGANATSAVTLNVKGLGAVPVVKNGSSALAPGDFATGQIFEVSYDGTNFQVTGANNGHGALINVQLITASGTYTPTAGATNGFAWVQGDGGAGGGTINLNGNFTLAAGGGSAGTFAIVRLPTLSSQTVTIGAGGAGVAGLTGGAGTGTSFGALCTCPGGLGGSPDGGTHGGTSGSADVGGQQAAPPGAPTGSGNIVFVKRGEPGTAGLALLNPQGGNGGNSFWGSGGPGGPSGNGSAGSNYGGGGAGAARIAAINPPAAAGFNGAQGAVLVFEYA
jgi:hypothetical protein